MKLTEFAVPSLALALWLPGELLAEKLPEIRASMIRIVRDPPPAVPLQRTPLYLRDEPSPTV